MRVLSVSYTHLDVYKRQVIELHGSVLRNYCERCHKFYGIDTVSYTHLDVYKRQLLTCSRDPAGGQCLVGSLTGAVASERVSEALKGSLRMVGNHPKSAKA